MSDPIPLGAIVDSLGVMAEISPDTLVDGAVVILRSLDPDNDRSVYLCWSDGMDFVTRRGLLELGLEFSKGGHA